MAALGARTVGRTASTLERTDHELVADVRRGDERAFEALYERYHRRIYAFVLGMVKDHGRAEDVTQEVFVSALRRMRATERPIAFKPWIYEIAKNACIDAFRRARRAEEVSYDAEEGLSPNDHRRLVVAGATPDAALAAKEELQTLCGAFGGLSDAHHEILVMRELEGLSYREIGDRMGMSRPAVESTLFRARRRLTEEYGELVSGERCQRVQTIIAAAAEGSLGARDARRLARHVAHCQPCRREALGSGLDRELIARPPLRRRVASKVAAWLPLPAFLRARRGGGGAGDDGGVVSGGGAAWASHLPAISDHMSAGWTKIAAGVAVLLAGVGAGVGMQHGLPAHASPAARAHNAAAPGDASGSAAAARQAGRALRGRRPRSLAAAGRPQRHGTRLDGRPAQRRRDDGLRSAGRGQRSRRHPLRRRRRTAEDGRPAEAHRAGVHHAAGPGAGPAAAARGAQAGAGGPARRSAGPARRSAGRDRGQGRGRPGRPAAGAGHGQ